MENFLDGIYVGLYLIGSVLIVFGPVALVYLLAKTTFFLQLLKKDKLKQF